VGDFRPETLVAAEAVARGLGVARRGVVDAIECDRRSGRHRWTTLDDFVYAAGTMRGHGAS
jgi:hypothetical protein